MDTSKYVYGVVAAGAPGISAEGVSGGQVGSVVAGELAAIVSDVPDGDLEAGRDALTAHARVLEEALQGSTVLPMRFGVVLSDDDAVRRQLLERHREELLAQLSQLEGKVELHLRAVYDEAALMADVVRGHPEIASLRNALHGQPEDATYFERIRLGELVAAAVEQRREADAAAIVDALAPLALATELGEARHERMVINASFLVGRDDMGRFDDAVEELGRANARMMRFKYTGPLPAHSFVELSLTA